MPESRIMVDSAIMMGKPVVAGTRITVEHLLRELAAGTTVEGLLEMHPHLSREDVEAALTYAADAVRVELVYPVPTGEAGA